MAISPRVPLQWQHPFYDPCHMPTKPILPITLFLDFISLPTCRSQQAKFCRTKNALLCRTLFKSKGGDWMNKEGGARIWEQRSKIRQRWRRKGYTNIFCPIFCFILNAYIVLLDINTLFQYLYIVTNRTRYYTMIFCQRYVHSLIAVTQKLLAINLKAPCVVASGPMKAFRHFFRKFHLSPWGGSPFILHPTSIHHFRAV